MYFLAILAQANAPQSGWDMIFGGTLPTKVVLLILSFASIASWVLIFWKQRQFSEVRKAEDLFLEKIEQSEDLKDAYESIMLLPDSPYGRVFRQGITFFRDLHPESFRKDPNESLGSGMSITQLQALKLVLEKEEAAERDELAQGLTWLAVIGSVAPLMGLMGTVLGITNTFLGIAASGSSNIDAVAPGVAEALVTTVMGLAVAIPAVIAYNHFVSKLSLISGALEGFSSEFIGALAREGRV
ncbi:MAG TPA: hypothetical protein EYQ69_01375 [Gemmatimonadetes bacterium]|jgi:biopolymer transport protein TolQ|nr:hypothetical protein [Gemmatimonadota bacterium]